MVDRVYERIIKNGWNISEFERRLDVATGTFNGWRKRNSVPVKKVAKIAEILGTTESYLRGDTDDPTLPISGNPAELDRLEIALLEGYRNLADDQKRIMIDMINALNKQ